AFSRTKGVTDGDGLHGCSFRAEWRWVKCRYGTRRVIEQNAERLSLAPMSRRSGAGVEVVMRVAERIELPREPERPLKDPRLQPATLCACRRVFLRPAPEDVEPRFIAACIDQPVSGDLRFPVQLHEHLGVLAYRFIADDFQDHVRRADQFDVVSLGSL